MRVSLLLAVLLVGSVAFAAPVNIVNSSFEDPVLADGSYDANTGSYGWVSESPGNNWIFNPGTGNTTNGAVTDGSNGFLSFNLGVNQSVGSMVTNAHYTIEVDVYAGAGGAPGSYAGAFLYVMMGGGSNPIIESNNTAYGTGSVLAAHNNANGDILNLVNTSPAGTGATNWSSNANLVYGDWYTLKLEWDVAADSTLSGPMTIVLRTNGGGGWTMFDNVRMDVSPIPEPATLGLLCMGTLITAVRRRKK